MKENLNTVLNLLKKYFLICKCFLPILVRPFLFVLKNYLKFQVRLLHLITTNNIVYFIHLFLLIHFLFNHKQTNALSLTDLACFISVMYILSISFMVQLVHKISKLKNAFIFLLGDKFVSVYLSLESKQFLKCFGPIIVFVSLEIVSEHIGNYLESQRYEACLNKYKLLHGEEISKWTEQTKSSFFLERSNINHSYRGVMSYLSNKIFF